MQHGAKEKKTFPRQAHAVVSQVIVQGRRDLTFECVVLQLSLRYARPEPVLANARYVLIKTAPKNGLAFSRSHLITDAVADRYITVVLVQLYENAAVFLSFPYSMFVSSLSW